MFQFSGLAFLSECYVFNIAGCPIRKSSDITLVCSSPKLIAAYHVLLRLLDPRHPPFALTCFKKVYSVLVLYHKCVQNRPLAIIVAIANKNDNSYSITRFYSIFSQYVKDLYNV